MDLFEATTSLPIVYDLTKKFFQIQSGRKFSTIEYNKYMKLMLHRDGYSYANVLGRRILDKIREDQLITGFELNKTGHKTFIASRIQGENGNGGNEEHQRTAFQKARDQLFNLVSNSDLLIHFDDVERCFKIYPVKRKSDL